MLFSSNIKDYFSSEENWIKKREKTIFKSLEEVEKYQKKRINYLKKYYKINDQINEYTDKIQSNIKKNNCLKMLRSGTTSLNEDRTYYYSMPEQTIMDKHHFWKIEKTHNILEPGDVIWIKPADPNLPDESGKVLGNPKKNRIYGPKKRFSLGENNVYELSFNAKFKKDHWMYNLNLAKELNPKLVRTSPSVVQTIYSYFGDEYNFNCPVVLSEESLHQEVRDMAEQMFSKVIDKCMCWDGGLGWFECPHKTKHIYDEFCLVEELEHGVLASTDLQNLSNLFFKYLNGDQGNIRKINCECGLSGNCFEFFQGKIIEAIFIENEAPIPGRYISEKLSGFFRLGKNYNLIGDNAFIDNDLSKITTPMQFPEKFVYRIKQQKNLEINFYYNCLGTLSEEHKKSTDDFLKTIIWQNKNCKKINFIRDENLFDKKFKRSKSLFIESDFIKDYQKELILKEAKKRIQ